MKRKILKYQTMIIGLLLFALIGQTSCVELDDRVYSEIVESQYKPTPLDELAKIGSAYSGFKPLCRRMRQGMSWDTDQTFNPAKAWGWNNTYQLFNHNYTSTSAEIDGGWTFAYNGINSCNELLSQLNAKGTDDEDNLKLIREVEAVRATYYYFLCDWYGNVAWATKYSGDEDYLPEQISRAVLADSIESALLKSLPYLSEDVDKKTYGRLTKWGAMAVLAKIYLNWGVYVHNDGDLGRWQDCLDICDSIIDSNKFGLTPTQKEIFSAKNDFCKEAIFAVVFDEIYSKGLNLYNQNLNGQHTRTYLITGGWGNGGSIMVPQFIDSYHPDDSRLRLNYLYGPQYDSEGNLMKAGLGEIAGEDFIILNEVLSCEGTGGNCTENMGYRLAKYEYEMGLHGGNMNNDIFLFRYADILMAKAECLLRTGQADEAAEIVTRVRQRNFSGSTAGTVTGAELMEGSLYAYGYKACIPVRGSYPKNPDGTWKYTTSDPNDPDAGGNDIVYGRFLDELGWEFEQEGRRRQDMIRFKTTSGKSVWIAKSWSSHKATNDVNKQLYPIPLKEIQANPNLTQNNGYN